MDLLDPFHLLVQSRQSYQLVPFPQYNQSDLLNQLDQFHLSYQLVPFLQYNQSDLLNQLDLLNLLDLSFQCIQSSLLHPCFEWDDSRAAEKYRREQAASLIRSVRVLVVSEDGEKEPARAYIRVLPAGADKPAYLPRAVVAAEPSLLSQAINEAVSDLRHAENRLAEFRALRKELSDLKQIRLRLEARPEAQA